MSSLGVVERDARVRCQTPTNKLLSKTVLIVDDMDGLREMLADFLPLLGMQVLEAAGAMEAIHTARSHTETIDLLLTDIEMPGMSGLKLAEKLTHMRPGIRVLYMSAGTNPLERTTSKQKPLGSYFIQKPFSLEELRTVLMSIFTE
ncbi:MAG TPA: response regulator [Candidatus Acidoferrum sp.]|nr:response regulator [Candidatus Acidoferrum sp.]